MPSDVSLDTPREGWVTIEGSILRVLTSDIMLDSHARRGGQPGSYRRALVHGPGDSLVLNFNRDYTGGVRINDARLNVRCVRGGEEALPATGEIGDLLVTWKSTMINGVPVGDHVTLWLCIGMPAQSVVLEGAVSWVPLSAGTPVRGSA